jgi:hypothetical protein
MAATTRRSSWLYDKLGELEREGQVRRSANTRGSWVWTGQSAEAAH